MLKLKTTLLAMLALFTCIAAPVRAADADLKEDLAKLQGKWKSTVTTDQGTGLWTLEIKGSKTKVVIESKEGEVYFKGECEFKLEKAGKFKAYTYFNLEVQSGDNAGQKMLTDGETRSSLYRLDYDSFTTVSGFEEGNDDKPRLIQWEKATK
ncbi:MAG: hypothetical protein HY674_21290 [Chloroflexi bacterium]|nr:hypothetical protein [Chloroflexota bacterium]